MNVVTTIRPGYRIKTADVVYLVAGSMKARSGYKYICKTPQGRSITLDRIDLIEAQKDGSAVVLCAA